MRVDLHTHTIASDGCWTPAELVEEVKKAGIGLFAAADHDTIGSIKELDALAFKDGLGFVSAVELTAKLGDKICHIIGYGIDPDEPGIIKICEENTRRMDELNLHQIDCLINAGLALDKEEFKNYTFDRRNGGGKVTNFVIYKGFFKTFQDALKFVVKNVDWDSPDYLHPRNIMSIIKNAGGHPVIAHPGSSLLNKRLEDSEIEAMIADGLEGLECYSPYHSINLTNYYINFCKKRNLLITAGSDCHGPILSRRLGEPTAHIKDLNLTGIWPS